eukprot:CAMPEP_0114300436 /NCGR_PEP_ID=MMETSP0059-20121206/13553_1 /TAXON_ID=36894 /ORGANISM="Pyramimonas parkeae, Strain CCMP726" /LENGTH=590 /DNA_ID=CAMNT_0001423069 /DNA_START=1 /DNA_END=1773 /DNA_ORIENTATION=+
MADLNSGLDTNPEGTSITSPVKSAAAQFKAAHAEGKTADMSAMAEAAAQAIMAAIANKTGSASPMPKVVERGESVAQPTSGNARPRGRPIGSKNSKKNAEGFPLPKFGTSLRSPYSANTNGKQNPKGQAIQGKPCSNCNLRKANCSFNSCRSCCFARGNRCRVHILDQLHGSQADPNPMRLRNLRELVDTYHAENADIKRWRAGVVQEHKEAVREAADAALLRYSGNISMLEELFDGRPFSHPPDDGICMGRNVKGGWMYQKAVSLRRRIQRQQERAAARVPVAAAAASSDPPSAPSLAPISPATSQPSVDPDPASTNLQPASERGLSPGAPALCAAPKSELSNEADVEARTPTEPRADAAADAVRSDRAGGAQAFRADLEAEDDEDDDAAATARVLQEHASFLERRATLMQNFDRLKQTTDMTSPLIEEETCIKAYSQYLGRPAWMPKLPVNPKLLLASADAAGAGETPKEPARHGTASRNSVAPGEEQDKESDQGDKGTKRSRSAASLDVEDRGGAPSDKQTSVEDGAAAEIVETKHPKQMQTKTFGPLDMAEMVSGKGFREVNVVHETGGGVFDAAAFLSNMVVIRL